MLGFPIMVQQLGEIAALATSVCWTLTALAFEYAAKRIGSLALNILRLVVALVLFTLISLVTTGAPVPLGVGADAWFWLILSGLVGFVFGDIFLFQAYADIGARTSLVIFSSSPLLTALLSLPILHEQLGLLSVIGMLVVVGGIALAVSRGSEGSSSAGDAVPVGRRIRGIACAFLGALGQSGGLILSKLGAPDMNPFAATQIRVIAGLAGFMVMLALLRKGPELRAAFTRRRVLAVLSIGAFFGPFLGVTLGLFAVQRSNAGIAATLMGLSPVLILIPAMLFKKEKIRVVEILGAVLAVAGSSLLFIR